MDSVTTVSSLDRKFIRKTIQIAARAAMRGNRPFGALLISADGTKLGEGENTQLTTDQVLAHAEMNLLHEAVQNHERSVLAKSTIYTSAEPCAMCAGAIIWSGVGRLVFGISGKRLHELSDFAPDMLLASSRAVLSQAGRKIDIVGPFLEEEAETLFINATR